MKIDKYITIKQQKEWLKKENFNEVIEHLNNTSKRDEKITTYSKNTSVSKFYDTFFDDKEKEEIIKSLLGFERAFYINTKISDTKKEIGNKYKIYVLLKEIEQNLRTKNSYFEYSKEKAINKRLYLTSTAQGLFDIIENTSTEQKINQVDFINYLLEVYTNVIVYIEENKINESKYEYIEILHDDYTWQRVKEINKINPIFEVYYDMSNMIKESMHLEKHLKPILIYYYEFIKKTIFWEKQIFNFENTLQLFINLELATVNNFIYKYNDKEEKIKLLNRKGLVNPKFIELYEYLIDKYSFYLDENDKSILSLFKKLKNTINKYKNSIS